MVKIKLAKGPMRWYLLLGGAVAAYWPWGTIYCINENAMKNKRLINHEMVHYQQQKKALEKIQTNEAMARLKDY